MGLHSSAGRALQCERRGHGFESRRRPKKTFFGLLRNCLNCDSTAMVTYSFHLINCAVLSCGAVYFSIFCQMICFLIFLVFFSWEWKSQHRKGVICEMPAKCVVTGAPGRDVKKLRITVGDERRFSYTYHCLTSEIPSAHEIMQTMR